MAEPAEKDKPRKTGRRKAMLMLGGLVVGEAALILGLMAVFSGPPKVHGGSALETTEAPEEEKIVEQLVADARFANSKRGFTYLYDTEIYVQVKMRHKESVAAELEQFANEIKAELTTIWRTSDPHDFDEPRLETLTRKVYALMDERFGADPQTEEPIIQKVVIVMGMGLRVDQ